MQVGQTGQMGQKADKADTVSTVSLQIERKQKRGRTFGIDRPTRVPVVYLYK